MNVHHGEKTVDIWLTRNESRNDGFRKSLELYYQQFNEMVKGKTAVYISHRLSSAVLSDKIYVFCDGTVKESGTHNELMDLGGKYSEMFTLQASSYKENEGSVAVI